MERIELLDVRRVRFAKHRAANVVRAPAMASDQCDGRSGEEGVQVGEIMHLALMTEARNCCQNAENSVFRRDQALLADCAARYRARKRRPPGQPSESYARITPTAGASRRDSRQARLCS